MQEVYRWKLYYKDGSVVENKFDTKDVAKLEMIPNDESFPNITLVIDGEKQLIFYARRFKDTLTDRVKYSIYFIGYTLDSHKFLLSVNSRTKELRIEDDSLKKN